jgi:alpha-tubulin suppressor-like RCC1 family protein
MSIKTDGTLWGWGNNASGHLGTGNTTNYSSPVQIGTLTYWSSVSAGISHTMFISSV